MEEQRVHTFHIPVLGLAFSVDTPIRVARFGISSVISIMDDVLIEHMRKRYSPEAGELYTPISQKDDDHRTRRITAYLNLVQHIVQKQVAEMKTSVFKKGSDIVRYFEMLADHSPLGDLYKRMEHTDDENLRTELQNELRSKIVAGAIDVNIMTKVDNKNKGSDGQDLPSEYSDALAAMCGFVKSDLTSSVILSAGINLRLFSYMGTCPEFLPDSKGNFKKMVVLKVSDYRSALIQGRILAKKGIWISEFRIESGLNCGGHAFATHGFLLGPVLEEFKKNRQIILNELRELYVQALQERSIPEPQVLQTRITVQGGIGTASEDAFLRDHYGVDGTGWGSPFLLVPEATNVDDHTRQQLANAPCEDYYLSNASPLGIPINNFRQSTSEIQRRERVDRGAPGSPCTKKFLRTNNEFSEEPLCVASKQYQDLKISQLKTQNYTPAQLEKEIQKVVEKVCLCEDLAAAAFINSDPHDGEKNRAVAICPGPNLAYFTKIVSLAEMVGHIYGKTQLISTNHRPNMFINELRLYLNYLWDEVQKRIDSFSTKDYNYLETFTINLEAGIDYYKSLIPKLVEETEKYRETMKEELLALEQELQEIMTPMVVV